MKKFLKILRIVVWILLVAGAGTLVGFVEVSQYARPCKNIKISINYGAADTLITKKNVDSIILKTVGLLKGKPLGMVNLGAVENAIGKQPYVANVHVYENNAGTIFIAIRQREPMLRIINRNFENFYLDESGILLPVNTDFSARVLVANGYINDSYIKSPKYRVNMLALADSIYYDSLLTTLYKLTMYITHDKFLKAQIDQIYVNEAGEFELIPRVGNHIIILGTADDLDAKFRKLLAFYKFGLNKIGWNKYNIINIKYQNQVLCTK
ncbi:MAG: cell division protein FtsQ [Bacteroidetes bacterium]|nr:cell division protein FtsQ [Bacteroidota bacterium]